jgi:uncharacterized protein
LIYLDANVFVYAALNRKTIGDKARSIIREVQRGKFVAVTSALSFDELVWAVKKQRGETEGALAGEVFLGMPRLTILDVKQELLSSALQLVRAYHLHPRDSIHAASALSTGADYIVSEDRDYDALEAEIRRKPILGVSTPPGA